MRSIQTEMHSLCSLHAVECEADGLPLWSIQHVDREHNRSYNMFCLITEAVFAKGRKTRSRSRDIFDI
jgi:hypothetical protein